MRACTDVFVVNFFTFLQVLHGLHVVLNMVNMALVVFDA